MITWIWMRKPGQIALANIVFRIALSINAQNLADIWLCVCVCVCVKNISKNSNEFTTIIIIHVSSFSYRVKVKGKKKQLNSRFVISFWLLYDDITVYTVYSTCQRNASYMHRTSHCSPTYIPKWKLHWIMMNAIRGNI